MDINTIFLVVGVSFFGYLVYKSLQSPVTTKPERFGLLVAQDTGKTKHNQSKTGDASLNIERVRRRTIQGHGRANKSKLKETRTQVGSTTGAMETFMLSSACPPATCCPYDAIFDGGGAGDEFCAYEGDGSTRYDAGNDTTNVCGV